MIGIAAALLIAVASPCGGPTTPEAEQCLAADLARADLELNRYYAAAVRRLTDEGQAAALAALRTSERAWIRHRDAECDAVWEYWKNGTIRGGKALGCKLTATRARAMAVWRTWLTYPDGTPSLLPRPEDGG